MKRTPTTVFSTFIKKASRIYQSPGCLGWFLKVLSFIVILTIIGSVYQNVAMARDRILYPPPGQLVDVGGYRLHLYCIGEGSPTVVLEAGFRSQGFIAWSLVQRQMAITTRVCSYDRAGLGWSDPDPADQPRYSPQVAQTLHTLLHTAGINGPYLLVGHSAGGLHMLNFAYQFPDETAGIVLVDSMSQNQYLVSPRDSTELFFDRFGWKYCHLMTAIGVVRLFGETSLSQPLGLLTSERGRFPVSDDLYQADLSTRNRTSYCRSVELELIANLTDGSQSAPFSSLGNLPLTVLTAGQSAVDPGWNNLQNELATLSTNSSHIVVEGGDHNLQFSHPDVVIDIVDLMITKVRTKQ